MKHILQSRFNPNRQKDLNESDISIHLKPHGRSPFKLYQRIASLVLLVKHEILTAIYASQIARSSCDNLQSLIRFHSLVKVDMLNPLILAASVAGLVTAHGHVQEYTIDGTTYPAFDPQHDYDAK
jgi:hypothetical protein